MSDHFGTLCIKGLSSPADTLISWITENKDYSKILSYKISLANNLTLDDKLLHRALIQIRNNNGSNKEPWETPALTQV